MFRKRISDTGFVLFVVAALAAALAIWWTAGAENTNPLYQHLIERWMGYAAIAWIVAGVAGAIALGCLLLNSLLWWLEQKLREHDELLVARTRAAVNAKRDESERARERIRAKLGTGRGGDA